MIGLLADAGKGAIIICCDPLQRIVKIVMDSILYSPSRAALQQKRWNTTDSKRSIHALGMQRSEAAATDGLSVADQL